MKPHIGVMFLLNVCTVLFFASCSFTPGAAPPLSTNLPPTETPWPFECDVYTVDHWPKLRFEEDTPEDYEDVVDRVWGVKAWTIPIRIEEGEDLWGRWHAASPSVLGLNYRVLFDRGEKLQQVAGYWDWQKISRPTLEQAIGCLGFPDYYIAALVEDRYDWLEFSLWYVEKGLVVHGSSRRQVISGQSDWPTIKRGTLMGSYSRTQEGSFMVVAPGNLERMAAAVYGPYLKTWKLCLIRPWPGSIEEVEILSFDEYVDCAT